MSDTDAYADTTKPMIMSSYFSVLLSTSPSELVEKLFQLFLTSNLDVLSPKTGFASGRRDSDPECQATEMRRVRLEACVFVLYTGM